MSENWCRPLTERESCDVESQNSTFLVFGTDIRTRLTLARDVRRAGVERFRVGVVGSFTR